MAHRTRPIALLLASAALAAVLGVHGAAQQGAPAVARPPEPPWPGPDAMAARRQTAENRPLFASREPLTLSIIADFGVVQRDRSYATTTYPGTLVVTGPDGTEKSIPIQLRTRGHSRRSPTVCAFAPLRLEFPTEPVGTPFEGQKNLKLGTHCRDTDEYEQYVLREYAVYQLHNRLTPRSFRARLATVKYVNVKNQKPVATRTGLLLEDNGDVAARLEGRTTDQLKVSYKETETRTSMLLALFEFMIGNTDVSISGQHNVILVKNPADTLFPVPYDFDYAGIVDARYALPDPRLKIASVRVRFFRGPCLPAEEFTEHLATFRSARADLSAVYDAVPNLKPGYVRSAKEYLNQFFELIDDGPTFQKAITRGCVDTM